MIAIPPKVYHPRALVLVSALLDDQIPASPGIPSTWAMIPRSVQWSRNSARKADTATIELDYRDFPLDPRMLKDLLVTIHVEDSLDPALPMVATPLNKRFVGLVDTPETQLDSGGEFVKLECRDYTGIWLDTKLASTPPLSLLMSLSAIVELLRVRITPLLPPVVFIDPTAAAFVPGYTKGKTILNVNKGESAWDVLSRLCAMYALVPVFDVDILTIRSATAYGVNRRSMVYGQNVESLSFRRSLTTEPKTKQIAVHCWDPVRGVPLLGLYVPPAIRVKLGTKGTPVSQITQVDYNVNGSYSVAELVKMAKRIYDEQATQQIEGEMATREMVDVLPLGRSLLGLANGDTLDIRLGRELEASIEGMSSPEAIAHLVDPTRPNSLNPAAAAALVQAWTTAGVLAVSFYIREASHTWDHADGYSLRVSFTNFLLGQGI